MRTEPVENTNSLTGNTKIKIFITDVGNKCYKANLSDVHHYHLLKSHFKPTPAHKFPSNFIHLCKRQYKVNYRESYQWMVYSSLLDRNFSVYCALFPSAEITFEKVVSKPFSKYQNIYEKANNNQSTK